VLASRFCRDRRLRLALSCMTGQFRAIFAVDVE